MFKQLMENPRFMEFIQSSSIAHQVQGSFGMPGTVFRGMQGMVPNPMYANIGLHPGFQGTQGQVGVSQGNLGMAGFSIPSVNMTPGHQHDTVQGAQMAPTGVPIMQTVSFDNLESMDKPKPYKEDDQSVQFDTFSGFDERNKVLSFLEQFDKAFAERNFTEAFKVRKAATFVKGNARAELFWDQIVAHFLELTEHESSQVRSVSLDALDRAICAVLGCERIKNEASSLQDASVEGVEINTVATGAQRKMFDSDAFECKVILPLQTLYSFGQSTEARSGALKILLHVLERHSEKLYHSWPNILELLRSVANTSEKDLVPLGFQSVCVVMNDGLMSIPSHALDTCIEVAGAFGAQKTDVNISLTAISLLWTTSDFFARGLSEERNIAEIGRRFSVGALHLKLRHQIDDLDTGPTETDVRMETLTASSEKRVDVDYKRLLLAVYDVIQGFGTDERPEVRNTAVDTLFMSVSRHGHKLSSTMLDHCLWNLVFPLIDTVRHLASTSSADEWQGRELGTQGGKPVHMLVHHSRNTAQKQWDETLVFVLNGIRRLLKHLFVLLQSLTNFRQGWDCLFDFIKESILNSSKEVAFAAITTLHVVVTTHASKGSMPRDYFEVAFSTYEGAITGTAHIQSGVVYKARQELLRNIVELYKQAYAMFEPDMYCRLLSCIDALARSPLNASDKPFSLQDNMPLVQRTVLEVIPLLKPLDDRMVCVWPDFLRLMVEFLVIGDNLSSMQGKNASNFSVKGIKGNATDNGHDSVELMEKRLSQTRAEQHGDSLLETQEYLNQSLNLKESIHCHTQPSETTSVEYIMESTFFETVVTILQTHYPMAPLPLRLEVLPDLIVGLGRCMCTRRDAPFGSLWRTATTAFNSILLKDTVSVSLLERPSKGQTERLSSGPGRPRFWKEVADVYEAFLVGSCGRAVTVSTESLSEDYLKADEIIEQNVLEVLCNTILKACQTASSEIITKLIHVIDRCASRTSMLPLASVELLPAHCSRFSSICLQALFSISRFDLCDEASSAFVVGRIAMPILVARCDFILKQFSRDENEQADVPLPAVRIEELVLVLKELARLTTPGGDFLEVKHFAFPVTAKSGAGRRIHLVMLYGSLCELVITREIRIRKLLLVLFRLLGLELGFS
ncbi:hypothetical protein L7F22_005965 [Adiantum nelumboides]|nr:hypothetical protein [Adiantum nelumboides]